MWFERLVLWVLLLTYSCLGFIGKSPAGRSLSSRSLKPVHMTANSGDDDDVSEARAMKPSIERAKRKAVDKTTKDTRRDESSGEREKEAGVLESMFGFLKSGQEDYYIYDEDPTTMSSAIASTSTESNSTLASESMTASATPSQGKESKQTDEAKQSIAFKKSIPNNMSSKGSSNTNSPSPVTIKSSISSPFISSSSPPSAVKSSPSRPAPQSDASIDVSIQKPKSPSSTTTKVSKSISASTSTSTIQPMASLDKTTSLSEKDEKVLPVNSESDASVTPAPAPRAVSLKAPVLTSAPTPTPAIVPRIEYNGPEPKKFYVAPSNYLNLATAGAQFAVRLGSGAFVDGYTAKLDTNSKNADSTYSILRIGSIAIRENGKGLRKQPVRPIELYEFEGCPFCRKVREAVSILDIDVSMKPCPRGSPNYRLKAKKMGGKSQFPYMVDPNTGIAMYESDAIIKYLWETYSDGEIPSCLTGGISTALACGVAMLPRLGKGSKYIESKISKNAKPIEFWGYEASPFCKIVREKLVELEIPHIIKTCARGSLKRNELFQKTGRFQVPFIMDPNTNTNMFESAEIINYLESTYALIPSPI